MQGRRHKLKARMALAAGVLLALSAAAFHASAKPPAGSRPVAQGPILDTRTGSYFELRIDNLVQNRSRWEEARLLSASKSYQGRQGRLAVVPDLETLDFIRDRFRINEEVWIGLRFFCKFRKLLWVTGEVHPLHENKLWARQWFRNQDVRCSTQRIEFMPVYLTREGEGIVWQASGPQKYFVSYLIEYPAPNVDQGKPEQGGGNEAAPPDGG